MVEDSDQPEAVQLDEGVILEIKQEPKEYDETAKHEAEATSSACGQAIGRIPSDQILEAYSPPEVYPLQVGGESVEKTRDRWPRISSIVLSQKETWNETNASLVARWMASSGATEVRSLRRSLRHQYRSVARRQPLMQNEVTLPGGVTSNSARRCVRRTNKKLSRPNYDPVIIEDNQETPDPQVGPLDLNDVFRRRFRKVSR